MTRIGICAICLAVVAATSVSATAGVAPMSYESLSSSGMSCNICCAKYSGDVCVPAVGETRNVRNCTLNQDGSCAQIYQYCGTGKVKMGPYKHDTCPYKHPDEGTVCELQIGAGECVVRDRWGCTPTIDKKCDCNYVIGGGEGVRGRDYCGVPPDIMCPQ